ncbi:MAG: DUF1592 domain-containing protein [Nannocystales bacterium]
MGCYAGTDANRGPGTGTDGQGTDGETTGSSQGETDGSDSGEEPPGTADCSLGAEPIRRLGRLEYANTLATLFPGVALPLDLPIEDGRVDGFVGHASGQTASTLSVARYEGLASDVAESAAQNLGSWAPCTDDSATCTEDIAAELAMRAYRRPLDAEEEAAARALATAAYSDFGQVEAVQVTVEAILQSPFFLYRPQFGVAGDGATVPLGDFEMASQLSYFFLDDMPDAELWAAAQAGELTDPDGLEAQARRLLVDPRAEDVLTGFLSEWLRLYKLEEVSLDEGAFPQWDETLQADLDESARLFLHEALWEADSWEALMSGSYGYVNDRLAPIFGVAAPGSADFVRVELDPTQRRGILTQPGILASTSHGISHSPIFRGVTVLDNIMCNPVPAAPPGFADEDPNDVSPEDICTTRDQVWLTHTNRSECLVCHNAIDNVGFTFENYDALGRFRTDENGCSIDASGAFPGEIGEVSGPIEAAEALANSTQTVRCAGEHVVRFTMGRSTREGDDCELEALADAVQAGGSLQEMFIQMTLSPTFRRRANTGESP